MRAAVDRLGYTAKGISLNPDGRYFFLILSAIGLPVVDLASPPDDAEDFLESLEDAEYDPETLKARRFTPASAAWLANAIRTKCDEQYEKREEEMERELAVRFNPMRQSFSKPYAAISECLPTPESP